MVYSESQKQRILFWHSFGLKAPTIKEKLEKEGIQTTRVGVHKFLKRYAERATTARRAGPGRRTKLTEEIKEIIDEEMQRNEETTAIELKTTLSSRGYDLSRNTILRYRRSLGWISRREMCRTIRERSKDSRAMDNRRVELTKEGADEDVGIVTWTDGAAVKMSNYSQKTLQPPTHQPWYVQTRDSPICIYPP